MGAVYKSLNDPDLYDERGRFRATEKVTQGFVFLCLPAEGNGFSHHLLAYQRVGRLSIIGMAPTRNICNT